MNSLLLRAAALAFTLAGPIASVQGALAQERPLTIGMGGSVTSTDPHYHNVTTNSMVAAHFFDTLVEQDESQKLRPGLAESWKAINDTTWEFKLRHGVKFSDGSTFDAEDVIATVKRAPNVPNSPSSFRVYVGQIKDVKVVDPYTVQLVTDKPAPLLPNDISQIFIINRKAVDASTNDFNSGKAMIGTGPFKFVEYAQGDKVTMNRNDEYWKGKPSFPAVQIRFMTNPASRVAALLAGDVQMIDSVPTADIPALSKNKDVHVVSAASNRLIYFAMDHMRDQTPFITDKAGQPLAKNPLRDLKVREALSMAINRDAISKRTMEGQSIPAGQLLPDGFFGTSKNLKPAKFDADAAKKLLAEAGYPDGFRMTIHGPNDRYINDDKIIQVAALNFSRIGIETKVEAMPWATFATRSSKQEFSFFLVGWGAGTGETSSPLRSLLATFDTTKNLGASNRGRYSNPALDAMIEKATSTIDDEARGKLLAEASEVAIKDLGIIPIHYEVSSWAMRKGLTYVGRADQWTLAQGVTQAK